MKTPLLLVLVVAAVASARPVCAGENRFRRAEIELVGPLRDVTIRQGAGGTRSAARDVPRTRTIVTGALAAGESKHQIVLVPVFEGAPLLEPRLEWDVGAEDERGRARFVRWMDAEDPLAAVVPALRSRPRPPVAPARIEVPQSAAWALVAVFLAVLAARRRPFAACLVGGAGGLLCAALVRIERGPEFAAAEVLEGQRGQSPWLAVESKWGRIELPRERLDAPFTVETEPGDADVRVSIAMRGEGAVAIDAAGARIHVLAPAPALSDLAADRNPGAPFDAVWTRVGGAWSARGAWPRGAALASALPAGEHAAAPPGWLVSGLPQGVDVLLGRIGTGPGARWVRLVGW